MVNLGEMQTFVFVFVFVAVVVVVVVVVVFVVVVRSAGSRVNKKFPSNQPQ